MDKNVLLKAIGQVKPATTLTSLTEQNNLIIFDGKTLQSYNDELLIMVPVKIKIVGGVPANELLTLLQKIKGNKVEIKQQDSFLNVVGKTTKAKLKISNIKTPKVDLPTKFKSLPQDFIKGIKYCRFSIAQPGNVLNNMLLTNDKVISCDNYRITSYIMKKDFFKKQCLIPSCAVNSLLSLSPTTFASNKHWLFLKNEEGVVLCIRNTEDKYPDILSIIKTKVKGVKIKLPEALKESLQRTKILSKEELETGNKMINITIENNLLTCHGECAIGEIDETIKIDYKEDKVVFTIVPDFLFEILDKTQTMVVGKKTLQFKTKNFLHNIQLIK